ncbi:MAG: hypothetical protein O3B38_01190 [Chloroflexi bacterium]|nr:hypothetical protein [Chloroflexota bacterium]
MDSRGGGNGRPMGHLQGYVKVLMNYDINPESSSEYYKYMLKKMVPDLEKLGLSMVEAWHTGWGEYPNRLVAFVAENRDTADRVMQSEEFSELEEKLQEFVSNYSCRRVPLRDHFQF